MMKYRVSLAIVFALFSGLGAADNHEEKVWRWCCFSPAELQKCQKLANMYDSFRVYCHYEDGVENCANSIRADISDMMFLDGGDIFRHARFLNVYVAEDYGEGDASYYAVAVAKKTLPESVSMTSLEGMKSCHTGVGKTSGWNTPMGWIARHMGRLDRNGLLHLYDPFVSSCAPGANISSYFNIIPNAGNSKWCALCKGDGEGNHVCDRDEEEGYYGYNGAYQCMKDGVGDIAFIKHSIAIKDVDKDNFILLCPDGSRKHPDEWRDCNLARVPAHALVMNRQTQEDAKDVYNMLEELRSQASPEDMFGDEKDLLWKSSTQQFLRMSETAVNYLGKEYYCNMLALNREKVSFRGPCLQRDD